MRVCVWGGGWGGGAETEQERERDQKKIIITLFFSQQTGSGAIPILVKLLESSEAEVREQAAWALGNVAGDGPESRDAVLLGGILQPLVKIIKNGEEEDSTKVILSRVLVEHVSSTSFDFDLRVKGKTVVRISSV